ncbi:DNA mismatch repair protein MSH3 [Lentinula edodes]|nr:DNA mismatch repair protein MSH3 [Lentinula edodes]
MPQSPEVQHQTRLSSYFTPSPSTKKAKRRASAIVDLTIDSSDEERPFKRQRGSSTSLDISPGPSKSSSASASYNRAEQWSFDSSHSTSTEKDRTHISNSELGSNKLSKREALKKKLLLERESSFFLQGRSSTDKGSSSRIQSGAIDENRDTDSEPEFWATSNASTSNISKGKQKAKPRAKRPEELGPSGEPWTPLEKQVLKLKGDNPGTLLMIEVGYKYKFFDEDAKIAASVLGMVAFRDRNFTVASIPVERRDIHLKNLLSHGHRVGIVNQVETAALKKVGENRNTPFERKLVRLYTAATYVDAMDSVDMTATHSPPPFLCIVEDRQAGKESDVSIALISVCPSIGDVVYDEFEDTLMRLELETRLAHLKPAELLCSRDGLTRPTEKLLAELTSTISGGTPGVRMERFQKLMTYTEAFSFLSTFYTEKRNTVLASENLRTGKLLASITSFSPGLVIGLAHMVKHLSTYNVADVLLETKFFTKFSEKSHMVLAANTLRNLEIFENETDHTVHGSLLWVLDQTKTKFGARLMKNWVGHPLTNRVVLQERVDAVEEIITSSSDKLVTLRQILKKLPDLARGLCRIQYGQCTPQELAILLPAFKKIAFAFEPMRDSDSSQAGFKSPLLNAIIHAFPALRSSITELIGSICIKRAAEGRKDQLWLDKEKYPRIEETRMGLHAVEIELREMLKTVRKILKRPSLEYETVAGEEFLVEVEKSARIDIPVSWRLISATKSKARYRPSDVQLKLEERYRWQETLDIEANHAYSLFMDEISENHYATMRNAVNKLAEADCLISLAQIGLQPSASYTRPEFVDTDQLEIVEGRHPMIELLRSDPFIPNTIRMGSQREPRSKIVTGPNMGGKSSSVRMVALIAIMAQIGCYVPAESVKMGMLDGVYTRMGAWDDIARGRSTFMVEMSETREILHSATKKSLVILDELGRGTSTFDGMSIAHAVLHHLLTATRCKTLFITHYPLVAAEIQKQCPGDVENLHMGYTTEERIDGTRDVVFMYRVGKGIAQDSFGVECGRMAGLPEDLLRAASDRSEMMREVVKGRVERNRVRNAVRLISLVRGLKDGREREQPEGNHSLEPGLILGMMRKLVSQINDS